MVRKISQFSLEWKISDMEMWNFKSKTQKFKLVQSEPNIQEIYMPINPTKTKLY